MSYWFGNNCISRVLFVDWKIIPQKDAQHIICTRETNFSFWHPDAGKVVQGTPPGLQEYSDCCKIWPLEYAIYFLKLFQEALRKNPSYILSGALAEG